MRPALGGNMIHDTAVIDRSAELDAGVEIGPYSIIGEGVKIGRGTVIGPHVVIEPYTEIGEGNEIHHGASIGGTPQDVGFKGHRTFVRIGKGNVIREYVTIHRATKEGDATVIGDNNYFMAYTHAGHDCKVGNGVVITNCTALAGHVQVEDFAVISAYVGIHQFVRIGTMAMISGLARVNRDVLPYTLVEGNPAATHGLNVVGLRRNGVKAEVRSALKRAYKILCRSGLAVDRALDRISEEVEETEEIRHLVKFARESKRGIIR